MATRFDDWEGQFLQHHGIKGQKWGVRRYQNPDGTLTLAGQKRYGMTDTGTGGSRKMSRQFNRAVKKLNRLEKRTDVEAQQAIANKYKKRAIAGAGATAALASAALGSHQRTALSNLEKYKGWRAEFDRADKASSEYIDWLFKHVGDNATLGYANVRKWGQEEIENMKYASRESAKWKKQSSFTTAGLSTTTKILGAVTIAAGGYTAYATARSKIAKSRTTAKGHAKAVAKYRAQYSKVVDQFKNTPYSAIVPEYNRNKKKRGS